MASAVTTPLLDPEQQELVGVDTRLADRCHVCGIDQELVGELCALGRQTPQQTTTCAHALEQSQAVPDAISGEREPIALVGVEWLDWDRDRVSHH
jgi:hypothetical protein